VRNRLYIQGLSRHLACLTARLSSAVQPSRLHIRRHQPGSDIAIARCPLLQLALAAGPAQPRIAPTAWRCFGHFGQRHGCHNHAALPAAVPHPCRSACRRACRVCGLWGYLGSWEPGGGDRQPVTDARPAPPAGSASRRDVRNPPRGPATTGYGHRQARPPPARRWRPGRRPSRHRPSCQAQTKAITRQPLQLHQFRTHDRTWRVRFR
jgi:hypothetical protein